MRAERTEMNSNESLKSNWAARARGTKFTSLGTVPENWEYKGGCRYIPQEVECELCRTRINYRFPLTHKDDEKKVLLIGSECVRHYYEAYQPSGLDLILALVTDAYTTTRKAVVADRLAKFREEYPIPVAFLLDTTDSKLKEFRRVVAEVVHPESKVVTHDVRSTAYYRGTLKRRGYLKLNEINDLDVTVRKWLESDRPLPASIANLPGIENQRGPIPLPPAPTVEDLVKLEDDVPGFTAGKP